MAEIDKAIQEGIARPSTPPVGREVFQRQAEILVKGTDVPAGHGRGVLDNPTEPEGGAEVAIDWGGALSGGLNTAIDLLQGQNPSARLATGIAPLAPNLQVPTALPAEVTVNTRTGEVKACRRRRRRRLLTPTDLSDLAALAAVVGKGDALKMAVAKAVRR